VLGAGAIGILSALVLQLRGLDVAVMSLEREDSPRAELLRRAGVLYSNAVREKVDILIEATGSASAGLHGITLLGPLGVMVVLGASIGGGTVSFLDLVVQNQMIAGSVNASPESFGSAVLDLGRLNPSILRGMIHRVGFSDFENSILGPPHMSPRWFMLFEKANNACLRARLRKGCRTLAAICEPAFRKLRITLTERRP
jgi:threonine dehydrogenase-like Zn-dependent dehydrogenase